MSTVDANTGNYDSFREDEMPIDEVAYTVVASASIPVYIDGGSGYGVDLVNAVARCREIVDDDSKIILDVILCFD